MTSVSSPCRKTCRMDPSVGLCAACGRTLAEIAAWGTMSEAERRAVMDGLPARLAAARRGEPVPRPPAPPVG